MSSTESTQFPLPLVLLLQHMAGWCVQYGEDLAEVLRIAEVNLDANELLNGTADKVTPEEYSRFYSVISHRWHEQAIGKPKWGALEASSSTLLTMGYCALSATSLGDALERVAHFINLFKDHRGSVNLDIRGDFAILSMRSLAEDPAQPSKPAPVLAADVNGLVVLHRFASWLIGHLMPLEEIGLVGAHHDGSHFFSLYQLFGCQTKLGQPKGYLKFSLKYLDSNIVQNAKSLEKLVNNAAYELLALSFTKPNLSTQILQLLGHYPGAAQPSFDEIAARLFVSPTTLRRHLHREHTSFQQIKDQWRCDLAARHLKAANTPIEDISELLGFSDANAFRRAFKKWTGLAPSEFREQYRINLMQNRNEASE